MKINAQQDTHTRNKKHQAYAANLDTINLFCLIKNNRHSNLCASAANKSITTEPNVIASKINCMIWWTRKQCCGNVAMLMAQKLEGNKCSKVKRIMQWVTERGKRNKTDITQAFILIMNAIFSMWWQNSIEFSLVVAQRPCLRLIFLFRHSRPLSIAAYHLFCASSLLFIIHGVKKTAAFLRCTHFQLIPCRYSINWPK